MNLLSVEQLTKSVADRTLFQNLNFGLSKGQRVALVARNGSGKTTLLNILAGTDLPDSGTVALRNGVSLAYLRQQPTFPAQATVLQAVLATEGPIQQAVRTYEALVATPGTEREFAAAFARMEELQAWEYEHEVQQVLQRLGITQLQQAVETLSGGQQKRVALAQALLARPDVLLLDEPTNHLDIEMVEWLEKYLVSSTLTLLLVTHDRYFLDNVCTQLLELADQTLYRHPGGYASFLEAKANRIGTQQQGADRARNLLRRELDWMLRQPKARGTKSKARIDAFGTLQQKAQGPAQGTALELGLPMARLGSKILELLQLSKSYGEKLILQNFSYTFRRGERLGIVGANGTGKTTFLQLLTGAQQPDAGTVTPGETVVIGYFTQHLPVWDPELRVLEVVTRIAEVVQVGKDETLTAPQFLQRFQFEPSRIYTPVGKLSGGERRRLHLLTVLIRQPNFLILDEPTNDLDLDTLQVLEDFLASYAGCLILVSHDRYFLDRLADHLFIFKGQGQIQDFNGNYTAYREEPEALLIPATKPTALAGNKTPEPAAKKKLSFAEQKEYAELENTVAELEARKEALTLSLGNGGSHEVLQLQGKELQKVINELDILTNRWLELAERA